MGLYAIGDTHLSLGVPKPMDIFGGNWVGYMDKLRENLYQLTEEDTLLLCGDMNWGLTLEQSFEDFRFLSQVPSKIILLKGNHDYWWTSRSKMESFVKQHEMNNLHFLHNNCFYYENVALCGTRGWFYEEDRGEHSEKIFRRELGRLEASLKEAGDVEKRCFLHYPPLTKNYRCDEIMELLQKYKVKHCYYGHLHGVMHKIAMEGLVENIQFHFIAADFLDCKPIQILE